MSKEDVTSQIFELQREFAINGQKVKIYENYALQTRRNIEKLKITIRELDSCSEAHKTFRLLGSAFFLDDKSRLKSDFEETIRRREGEVEEFAKYRTHFDGKCKEVERQLKELMKPATT
eukprot:TRINITY_DN240_c0_g2_i1.p1 TRINITY_DN240_c0_g2~~TRINITY_DN240_c0_g2_i1.p1  ORF type:complete len:119 (+),score=35.26 TRINITY_DN240_c0_g2_i1:70-426(+)